MVAFLFIVVIGIVILAVRLGASSQPGSVYQKLLSNGVQARGILLTVNNVGVRQPGGQSRGGPAGGVVRFERRDVRLDVELPGQAPYEIQTSALIPTNLSGDIFPGTTVELRLDKGNRSNIAIVGLGIGLPAATSLVTGAP